MVAGVGTNVPAITEPSSPYSPKRSSRSAGRHAARAGHKAADAHSKEHVGGFHVGCRSVFAGWLPSPNRAWYIQGWFDLFRERPPADELAEQARMKILERWSEECALSRRDGGAEAWND
jgi:hypothetical protein